MAIKYLIAKDSKPEEVDEAFQAAGFAYRTIIFDYVRSHDIESIINLAQNAGCEYPEIMERFIRTGKSIPSGKDMDYLIDHIDGKGKWLKSMKDIQIHASLGNAEPAVYPNKIQLDKDTDLAIREALNKLDWFYFESSTRFLTQNPPQ